MLKQFMVLFIMAITSLSVPAQLPFGLYLEPIQINGLNGLQAYAVGQAQGKWLLVGGRLDGLHRRQPFAAFDTTFNNDALLVVDPQSEQQWSAPINSLPVSIREQLRSTNMQFYQEDQYLYLIGGYGYQYSTSSKITFDKLLAIDVPQVIQAVINNSNLTSYFRQISDPQFAVTGGHLKKINQTYYLLGGNRFDGNYNPMGNPTYTQQYTNAVRKFSLVDDGVNISINHLPGIYDSINLHRRDYNAVSQILPNGAEAITMFSGVFQPTIDLPYLNCVEVDSTAAVVNNTFQQRYNHYHCAVLPLYGANAQTMHNVFFGGIAQFYDSADVLIQDNNVPFVKTIACVTRNTTGQLSEQLLPISLPNFLGSASEFIHAENVPTYPNHVIKLDDLTADSTLVGYVFGGINSPQKNIFGNNSSASSSASDVLFKVYVLKQHAASIPEHVGSDLNALQLSVFPNPANDQFQLQYDALRSSSISINIFNDLGELIYAKKELNAVRGKNIYPLNNLRTGSSSFLMIKVDDSGKTSSLKVILED